MLVIGSDIHHRHHCGEIHDGQLVPSFESPARIDLCRHALSAAGHSFAEPEPFDMAMVAAIHDADYLEFLQTAWKAWEDAHPGVEYAFAFTWPTRSATNRRPTHVDGLLGYYNLSADCSIVAGTWDAAAASAAIAHHGAISAYETGDPVLALCRPPGHHATTDQFGGYCYLNNAAVAAHALRDAGAARVAIIDIDYHHGNGTQDIFYERNDVTFASLHGDPATEFPYFVGYADETGTGAGEGANLNVPLPWGTTGADWLAALDQVIDWSLATGPDALVVSVGLDPYFDDPISNFAVQTPDFALAGERLAVFDAPTALVFEGGYATEALGTNLTTLLDGYERARS